MSRPARTAQLPVYEGEERAKVRAWSELAGTFYRVQRRVVALLSEHEVTLPQFDVLATLRYSEGVTQQELAERLLVTKGNVCGVLDRLEKLGWVERRSDPKDARANRLYLTAGGKRKVDALLPRHDELIVSVMGGLKGADVQMLRGALAELRAGAEAD